MQIFYPKKVFWRGAAYYNFDNLPRRGSIKATHDLGDSLFQIYPLVRENFSDILRAILKRWILINSEDIFLFNDIVNSVLKQRSDYSICVQVPALIGCVDLHINNTSGVICEWEKANGVCLNSLFSNDGFPESDLCEIMLCIVQFISNLHHYESGIIKEFDNSSRSLRKYYENRFSQLVNAFSYISSIDYGAQEFSKKVIKKASDCLAGIDEAIYATEHVCLVHGDLRFENILLNESHNAIWLLDFDQGIFGGDWFIDFWKLGLISDGFISRKYPLDARHRKRIFSRYLNEQPELPQCIFSSDNQEFINKRIDLLRADFILSSYVLRHAMGWDFVEKINDSGDCVRGYKFIEKLFHRAFPS